MTNVLPRGCARALCALVTSLLVLVARPALGEKQDDPLYAPSTFLYGLDGLMLGAGAGLGAGYLAARAGGWHKDDWQALVYGTGIGALAGAGLGLALGITDMTNETQGRGYFVLRDGGYGLGFGLVTGAIVGSLAAVASKKPENILFGSAVGGLFGAGAGVGLGIFEGQRAWRRHTSVAFALAPAAESSGKVVWMPALTGRY